MGNRTAASVSSAFAAAREAFVATPSGSASPPVPTPTRVPAEDSGTLAELEAMRARLAALEASVAAAEANAVPAVTAPDKIDAQASASALVPGTARASAAAVAAAPLKTWAPVSPPPGIRSAACQGRSRPAPSGSTASPALHPSPGTGRCAPFPALTPATAPRPPAEASAAATDEGFVTGSVRERLATFQGHGRDTVATTAKTTSSVGSVAARAAAFMPGGGSWQKKEAPHMHSGAVNGTAGGGGVAQSGGKVVALRRTSPAVVSTPAGRDFGSTLQPPAFPAHAQNSSSGSARDVPAYGRAPTKALAGRATTDQQSSKGDEVAALRARLKELEGAPPPLPAPPPMSGCGPMPPPGSCMAAPAPPPLPSPAPMPSAPAPISPGFASRLTAPAPAPPPVPFAGPAGYDNPAWAAAAAMRHRAVEESDTDDEDEGTGYGRSATKPLVVGYAPPAPAPAPSASRAPPTAPRPAQIDIPGAFQPAPAPLRAGDFGSAAPNAVPAAPAPVPTPTLPPAAVTTSTPAEDNELAALRARLAQLESGVSARTPALATVPTLASPGAHAGQRQHSEERGEEFGVSGSVAARRAMFGGGGSIGATAGALSGLDGADLGSRSGDIKHRADAIDLIMRPGGLCVPSAPFPSAVPTASVPVHEPQTEVVGRVNVKSDLHTNDASISFVSGAMAPPLSLPSDLPIDKIATFAEREKGDAEYGAGAVKARAALFGGVQGSQPQMSRFR